MNQNGDPTQAWIKLKPDGRVDVFAGNRRHWPGLENGPHPDRRRHAGGSVRLGDDGQLEHRFLGGLYRYFRLPRHVHRREAVRFAAERVRERILDIASKELEIAAGDLEITDGEVVAKGAPDRKISVAEVAGAAPTTMGSCSRARARR